MNTENSLYNAPAAKCPILGDGGNVATNNGLPLTVWNEGSAPTGSSRVLGNIYYLVEDCPDIGESAKWKTLWQWTEDGWRQVNGDIKVFIND